METKPKITTIKVDQKLYSQLKRMRHEAWVKTGEEPTYQQLIADLIAAKVPDQEAPTPGYQMIAVPEDLAPTIEALMKVLSDWQRKTTK